MSMLASRLRAAIRPRGARFMSGHSMEHVIEETEKWKKISFAFIPFVGVYAVFVGVKHFSHHHEAEEQVKYPFIKKRDKMMPWAARGGTDCDLFDYHCSARIKAAKAAAAAAE